MNKFIITEEQIRLIKESIGIDEVKLPDFIIKSIKDSKTSLGDHPSFPPENELKFEEKILKKRYYELLTSIKKVDGINGDISKKSLITKLSELTIKCKHIEEPIKDSLEKICFEFVNEMFGLTPGDINIECNLTDEIEIKQPITPKKMLEDFDDISSIESLNKEILKRRLVDSIIQGSCVRCSSNYEKILTKIYSLDHRLPELYHDITAINEYLSFVKEQKPNNDNIGGEVSVDLTSEDPSIKSEAIIFPVLVFETVKGIMELLCSHGLPESKKDAEYIIGKADFLLAENWDKRLGVGLWDLIMDTIGYDNANIMPYILMELISMPVDEFNINMREVFGITKKGKEIINNIINNISRENSFEEIENTLSNNSNNEYFTPEELLSSTISETDTTSAGEYTYDVPLFGDKETLDHKNLITRSIQDGLNESKDYYDFFDSNPVRNVIDKFLSDKYSGVKIKKWNLIPFEQYRNALIEFMRYGQFMRFPVKYIDRWANICTENTLDVQGITELAGHTRYFPYDEFIDSFGLQDSEDDYINDAEKSGVFLEEQGFYDWCKLPDGSDAWSDYGLEPLYKLIMELEEQTTAEQKIVVINKILDVYHTRGDLASAFIEGGSASLNKISEKTNKHGEILNESVNKPDIFTHTTYKIPSKNDLIQLNSFGLPASEIVKGLSYTIVGKGIKNSKTDAMISASIKNLCEMYPDNQEYKKALEIVSK